METAIESNPGMEKELQKMFRPVLDQLTRLIERKELADSVPSTETTISVSAEGCLFVIMN